MRLIDADALMESIGCADAVKYGNRDRAQQDTSYSTMMLYEIRDEIDAMPTIGGWISTDEQPPKQGRYLVWGLTQVIPDHNDEPNGYWQMKIAQWFEEIGWDCKVKFWQMLPEPSKEEHDADA